MAVFAALAGVAIAVVQPLVRWGVHAGRARKRRADLAAVAKIRTEGVTLRNEALNFSATQADAQAKVQVWIHRIDEWDKRAEEAVSTFAPHEGEMFKTVDRWKFRGEDDLLYDDEHKVDRSVSPEHRMYAGLASAKLRSLKELLIRYSPTELD